jgi:3-hydroxymyristoyl/3-hydroxydecanoyl-(acyl carrier protein) dehydratase
MIQTQVGIPAAHPDFSGHFPGFPLLPAVSQISLVKELIEQQLGHEIDCLGVTRSKFKAMLRPNTNVDVEINFVSATEARWKIWDAQQTYSLGNLAYEQVKDSTAMSKR